MTPTALDYPERSGGGGEAGHELHEGGFAEGFAGEFAGELALAHHEDATTEADQLG